MLSQAGACADLYWFRSPEGILLVALFRHVCCRGRVDHPLLYPHGPGSISPGECLPAKPGGNLVRSGVFLLPWYPLGRRSKPDLRLLPPMKMTMGLENGLVTGHLNGKSIIPCCFINLFTPHCRRLSPCWLLQQCGCVVFTGLGTLPWRSDRYLCGTSLSRGTKTDGSRIDRIYPRSGC